MKAHKCIKQVNKKLKEHNTQLVCNLFNENDIFVATERIETGRGKKKAVALLATYCPVCGKKLKR